MVQEHYGKIKYEIIIVKTRNNIVTVELKIDGLKFSQCSGAKCTLTGSFRMCAIYGWKDLEV